MPRCPVLIALVVLGVGSPLIAEELFPSPSLNLTNQGMSHFDKTFAKLTGFEDVRFSRVQTKASEAVLRTLTFNRSTQWSGVPSSLPEAILVDGADPGLGVRELQRQGHTGRGVVVAIIDQNLAGDHPEFEGKLRKYVDLGCDQDPESGSMHGPAVTSLLVGTHLGTAPEALVDYYAAPSWKADAEYYARALDQIVASNAKLPPGDRVRAVSVSAAPSGPGSPFTKNGRLWDVAVTKAREAGLLVVDCTTDRGFVSPGYFDPHDRDNLESFSPGWPQQKGRPQGGTTLHAPSSVA